MNYKKCENYPQCTYIECECHQKTLFEEHFKSTKTIKFSILKKIVIEHAEQLKMAAQYNGDWSDGGYSNLLDKLNNYKNSLIVKLDLKPSEFYKLYDIDVDEPSEFSSIIKKYKSKT